MHRWMTCGAAIGVDFAPHLFELSSIIRVPNVKTDIKRTRCGGCWDWRWEGSNNSITSQHCFGGGVTLCQQDIKHTAQHAEAPFPRHAAKLQPQGQYIQVSWIIWMAVCEISSWQKCHFAGFAEREFCCVGLEHTFLDKFSSHWNPGHITYRNPTYPPFIRECVISTWGWKHRISRISSCFASPKNMLPWLTRWKSIPLWSMCTFNAKVAVDVCLMPSQQRRFVVGVCFWDGSAAGLYGCRIFNLATYTFQRLVFFTFLFRK